jgi:Uncharacterised nucleotidyltransferase
MAPPSPIDLLIPLLNEPADLSALGHEASWNRIKENAGRYGVAALIAYAARSHVSTAERAWCDRVLTDSWMRHERSLGQLEYLVSIFEGEGIPTIALKGPMLARRYYSPPFLRKPALDLDLAVTAQDLPRACDALIKAGYNPEASISESKARSHHVTLSHPTRTRVELHFRLSHQALGIPVDEFFERTVSCRLPNGQEVRVLGAADQILHLILHLAHSRFGTLFNLYELRRVCGAEPPAARVDAIRMAVDHRYCAVLRMLDLAFRTRCGQPFLTPEVAVRGTWLNWRLNEKLYAQFEHASEPGLGMTLGTRMRGRWLDFQLTDGPSDAARWLKLFAQTARFQIARGAWGKVKDLSYGPNYSAR